MLLPDVSSTLAACTERRCSKLFAGAMLCMKVGACALVPRVLTCTLYILMNTLDSCLYVMFVRYFLATIGTLSSLKRHKDDISQADSGSECGVSFSHYDDVQEGDTIECYESKDIPATLTPVE
jgi:translation initiation factor IF-2